MRIVSVGELNNYIKRKFDADANLAAICIRGEISNFKHHYSGHMYMSLKDATGAIKAVMFKSSAASLKFAPKDGMSILAVGRVGVYERDGVYQLYIDTMIPDGVGALYAAYEQLKAELEEKGYFDPSHKKELPRYPEVIGVVTASTGAAVRDIINVISRRFPLCDIKVYPAKVQGIGAAESICKGIEYFNLHTKADVLIVGRGGGSIEDLWAFNEREVAMSIYNSQIPVISAVGHETDFTIADFVADMRAPTPSAAAELATPDITEIRAFLKNAGLRLTSALTSLADSKEQRLKLAMASTVMKNPMSAVDNKALYLDEITNRLLNVYTKLTDDCALRLKEASYKLGALNPVNVLQRGYSVAKTAKGVVRKKSDLRKGEDFVLTVSDGDIECIVK